MSNNSWKEYGGTYKTDKLHNVGVGTIIADSVVLRQANLASYTVNGDFKVTGTSTLDEDVIAGNNLVVNIDTTVKGNTYLHKNEYIDGKLFFGTTTTDTTGSYRFISGNSISGLFGINTLTPTSVLDITSDLSNVLSLRTSSQTIRNVLAQNSSNNGITSQADTNSSTIGFYYGNVSNGINANSRITSSLGNTLTLSSMTTIIDSSNNTFNSNSGNTIIYSRNSTNMTSNVIMSKRNIGGNIGSNVIGELLTIYDTSNSKYLYDNYENPNINTGYGLSIIALDNSSNTFMNVISPNNSGLSIGGGAYVNDSRRSMGVLGTLSLSGSFMPSQMVVSGNNLIKYKNTTGFNTYGPNTENYVLDINGPTRIVNGEITTVKQLDFQILSMKFSKTNRNVGYAVGTPSSIGNGTLAVPYINKILRTNNGGETWSDASFGNSEGLYLTTHNFCLYAYDSSIAYIGTDNNFLYYTSNTGNSWNSIKSHKGNIKYTFSDIYISSNTNNNNYAFDNDNFYRTTTTTTKTNFNNENLTVPGSKKKYRVLLAGHSPDSSGLLFNFDTDNLNINNNSVDICYNYVKTSHNKIFAIDGSSDFVYVVGDNGIDKFDISGSIPNLSYTINNITGLTLDSIYCFDASYAVAVGNGTIVRTYDSIEWTRVGIGSIKLRSIYIYDLSNAVAVGDNGSFMYTKNGSLSWQKVPFNILNTCGIGNLITRIDNSLNSISMPDLNTFIIADVSRNYNINGNVLGNSKIIYGFFPNLFNRVNNQLLDICGNMHITGDIMVDGEGKISTTNTLFYLLNEVVKTITFGSTTTLINIGGYDTLNSMLGRLFVNGDTSMNSRLFVGQDVSLNSRLFVNSDTSMNSRLFVGQDVSLNSRLFVNSDTSMNSRLFVGQDVSLNSRLFVNSDTSLNSRLFVGQDVSLNSRLFVNSDTSMNSRLFVGQDVSLNSRLFVNSDTSMNSKLFVGQDVSLNSKLFVGNDTSMNSKLFVGQDVSLNSRLFVNSDTSMNSRLFVGQDVSLNSRLFVNSDTSMNSRLFVGQDVSLNSRLFVNSDTSMNSRLFVGQDVSLNSRLFVNSDTSMNSRLFVGQDVSLNSKLFVSNDTSMNSKLFVGQDVSLNSRLFVNSDTSMNSRLFVGQDVSLNSRLFVNSDTSMNSTLFVGQDVSLNSKLFVNSDTSLNSKLFVGQDVSLNSRLFVNRDTSMNSRLFVGQDVSLNSKLFVNSDTSMNSTLFVGQDVSLNSRLFVNRDTSLNSKLFVGQDVSLNSKLFVSNDTSMNSRLFVGQDVSLNSKLFVNSDTSMNSRLFVGQDVSLNSKLFVNSDTSMNSRLFVGQDVSLNSKLFVNSDTSMNSKLFVGQDVSLNSRLFVNSDTSMNSRLFVRQDVSLNSKLFVNSDTSMNSTLFVGKDVSLNSKLFVSNDTSMNSRLFVGQDVSLNSRLFVNSDTSMNSKLFVGSDISLGGRLFASGLSTMSGGLISYSDVSFNNRVLVGSDLLLGGRLFVSGLSTMTQGLISYSDVSFINRVLVGSDVSLGGRLFVYGNTYFNSNLFISNIENVTGISNFTGNINAGNIITGNIVTGNIVTGNIVTGNISVTGNIVTGNINARNVVSGNITNSGNINTKNISISDNLYSDYIKPFGINNKIVIGVDATTNLEFIGIPKFTTAGNVTYNNYQVTNVTIANTVAAGDGISRVIFNRGTGTNSDGKGLIFEDSDVSGSFLVSTDKYGYNFKAPYSKNTVRLDVSNLNFNNLSSFSQGIVVLNKSSSNDSSYNITLNSNIDTNYGGNNDFYISTRLFVGSDLSLGTRLFIQGTTIIGDASFINRVIVGSDLSLGSRLFVQGVSVFTGDASFNNRVIVGSDLSLGSRLFVQGASVLIGDASFNNRVIVGSDLSLGSRLFVQGASVLIGDANFNNRVIVGSDLSLGTRLFIQGTTIIGDASFNNRVIVGSDVSLGGRLFVSNNVVINKDVSINGNLYANYPINSIPSTAINGGTLKVGTSTNSSISGNLYSSINTLLFDTDSGFVVDPSNSGTAIVTMNSTFKYWDVSGQTAGNLVANGLDKVVFVAGNNIAISTNPKTTDETNNLLTITTVNVMDTISDQTISGNKTFNNNAKINGNLMVIRDASFSSRVLVGSDVSLGGRLFVNGISYFNSDLVISGKTNITGSVTAGNIYASGDVSINGNLITNTIKDKANKDIISSNNNLNLNIGSSYDNITIGKTGGTITFNGAIVASSQTTQTNTTIFTISDVSLGLNTITFNANSNAKGLPGRGFIFSDIYNNVVGVSGYFVTSNDLSGFIFKAPYDNNVVRLDVGNLNLAKTNIKGQTIKSGLVVLNSAVSNRNPNATSDIPDGSYNISLNKFFDANHDNNNNFYIYSSLSLSGDASFNSRILVGSDLTIGGRLFINGTQFTGTGGSTFTTDISTQGKIFGNLDASFNSRVLVGSDLSLGGRLFVQGTTVLIGDASFNNRVLIGSDLSLGRRLFIQGTSVIGDASFNSRILVGSDVSLGGRLIVGNDALIIGNVNLNSTNILLTPNPINNFVCSNTQPDTVGNTITFNDKTNTILSGIVSSSSNSNNAYRAFRSAADIISLRGDTFNDVNNNNLDQYWISGNNSYSNTNNSNYSFTGTGKLTTISRQSTTGQTSILSGEWLQIQLPYRYIMTSFTLLLSPPATLKSSGRRSIVNAANIPGHFYICGSNLGQDTSVWIPIIEISMNNVANFNYSSGFYNDSVQDNYPFIPINFNIPFQQTSTNTTPYTTNSTSTSPALSYNYNTFSNNTNGFLYYRLIILKLYGSFSIGTTSNSVVMADTYAIVPSWNPTFNLYNTNIYANQLNIDSQVINYQQVTLSGGLISNTDASFNNRILVGSDVSLGGRLFVQGNAIFQTAPVMSGANITAGTIPINRVAGTAMDITNDQTIGGTKSFANQITASQGLLINVPKVIQTGSGVINLSIGDSTQFQNINLASSGNFNYVFGYNNCAALTTGGTNLAFGRSNLQSETTGSDNLGIGVNNLNKQVGGFKNIGIGFGNMNDSPYGYFNVGIGINTLNNCNGGNNNIAIGISTLQNLTTGGGNTAIGYAALAAITTASSSNLAIGNRAGINLNNGNNNTFIGVESGPANGDNTTYNNSIAIGYRAIINASNQLSLGTSETTVVVSGDASFNNRVIVGSDLSLGGRLFVSGNATFLSPPAMSGASISNGTIPILSIAGTAMDITTNQSVDGIKTFSSPPVMSGASISNGTIPIAAINGTLVDTINSQTVAGIKTFSSPPVMSGASITGNTIPIGSVLGTAMDLTTNQSVGGIKTFSSPPVMSGASISNGTIPIAAINGTLVDTINSQTVAGIKTFSSPPVMSGASITSGTIPLTALNGTVASSGVDLSTNQTIGGNKIFSSTTSIGGNNISTTFTTAPPAANNSSIIVQGNAYVVGNIFCNKQIQAQSFNATSDYRIKTNVVQLNDSYTVKNLIPRKYYHKELKRFDLGLIAHELQEQYPLLVQGKKDGEELQTVNYNGIIPILINDFQNQQKQIASLIAEIEILKEKINKLENEK